MTLSEVTKNKECGEKISLSRTSCAIEPKIDTILKHNYTRIDFENVISGWALANGCLDLQKKPYQCSII
jgi:hypothetical protein